MSFVAGFGKTAGIKTEVVGSVLGLPISVVGGLSGLIAGPYNKEQQEKADKGTFSNFLIGPVGAHRLTRRLLKERKEHAEKTANVLTAKARKAIKEDNFALPGRRYPIENKIHARNALARVAQHGTPEEQAKVRAAVHKKYPTMGKEGAAKTLGASIKSVGRHFVNNRKDYMVGAAAAGSLGTAYGANKGKK